MTPARAKTLRVLSWILAGFAVTMAAYALFSLWAVNAESLGKHDAGLALFFAFSGAWALIGCLWLAPVCALLALAAWLTRAGSPIACIVASAASAVPFLFLK